MKEYLKPCSERKTNGSWSLIYFTFLRLVVLVPSINLAFFCILFQSPTDFVMEPQAALFVFWFFYSLQICHFIVSFFQYTVKFLFC